MFLQKKFLGRFVFCCKQFSPSFVTLEMLSMTSTTPASIDLFWPDGFVCFKGKLNDPGALEFGWAFKKVKYQSTNCGQYRRLKCLGVFNCPTCSHLVRPKINQNEQQLKLLMCPYCVSCPTLIHNMCNAKMAIHVQNSEFQAQHFDYHNHEFPPLFQSNSKIYHLKQPKKQTASSTAVVDEFWPNGDCVFEVSPDNPDLLKFGWAFKEISFHKNAGSHYLRSVCIGCFICPECLRPQRPKMKHVIQQIGLVKCKKCLSSPLLKYYSCKAKISVYFQNDSVIIKHFGFHKHEKPPISTHLTPSIKSKFFETVLNLRYLKPKELVTGLDCSSVRDIHPAFGNIDSVGYRRRRYLENSGKKLSNTTDKFVQQIWQFQHDNTENFVEVSLILDSTIISLIGTFSNQLLQVAVKNLWPVCSDCTFNIINDFYLFTSSVYSASLEKHVPVIISIINGLSEKNFLPHFKTLLKMTNSVPFLSTMDFSLAQQNAYLLCLQEIGISSEESKNFVAGCDFHFEQSLVRVLHNYAVIPQQKSVLFRNLIYQLREETDISNFNILKKNILSQFSNCKLWLEWWASPSIRHLVFKCFGKNFGFTTNSIESLHSLFKRIVGTHLSLSDGLSRFLGLIKSYEDDFNSVKLGYDVNYKRSTPKQNRKRKIPQNDGRPPDTSALLLQKKGRGRPPQKRNKNAIVNTTFLSYKWKNNSCYIDVFMESFYWVFAHDLILLNSDYSEHEAVQILTNSFKMRHNLQKVDDSAILFRSWITDEKRLYKPGEFGSLFEIVSYVFKGFPQVTLAKSIFICSKKCSKTENIIQSPVIIVSIQDVQFMFGKISSICMKSMLEKFLSGNSVAESRTCKVCQGKMENSRQLCLPEKLLIFEFCDLFSVKFSIQESIFVNGSEYKLYSLIYTSHEKGLHYFCETLASPPGLITGFYRYMNRGDGESKLITNTDMSHLLGKNLAGAIFVKT